VTEQTAFTRFPNREAWLEALIAALRPLFSKAEYPLPDHVRVACGWPKSGGGIRHAQAVGTTWGGAADGILQVFISPVLVDVVGDDGQGVGSVLTHELVHTQAGLEAKHGLAFKRVAAAVGLQAPWTATVASPALRKLLIELAEPLGPYPHSPLGEPTHKQGTRMLKLVCAVCQYTVRTSQQWLDVGTPFCPDGDPLERAV
jgi:hypothetical protein